MIVRQIGPGMIQQQQVRCPACEGSGTLSLFVVFFVTLIGFDVVLLWKPLLVMHVSIFFVRLWEQCNGIQCIPCTVFV